MRTLRGTKIVESGCLDADLNIFYSLSDDGRKYVLRQPRKGDAGKQRKAWKQLSDRSKERYVRANIEEQWLYTVNQRCRRPLYRGEVPGVLPLTVEVDGEVVGFCDGFFRYGVDFSRYEVGETDLCGNFSLGVLDKFQGMGIGTYYSTLTHHISRHFGCKWELGQTYIKGGLYHIRMRDGWEVVSKTKDFVVFKVLL